MQAVGVGVLACTLVVTSGLAQVQPSETSTVPQSPVGKKGTIEGKIKKGYRGSYIVRTRAEVLTISNPYPAVLEPLTKSDTMVRIDAFAAGDRLTIVAINGKKYEDIQKPAAK
jgi:hypothetical protein